MSRRKAEPALTREGVRAEVSRRYATRFHMTLIIASSIAVGTLTTAALMRVGVETLWLRWLPALACAYLAFFAGVWVWLNLSAYGRYLREESRRGRESLLDGGDVLDVVSNLPIPRGGGSVASDVVRGAGGAFDGGGASMSWAADAASSASSSSSSGIADGIGEAVGDAVGGSDEGGCALVVAGILVALVLAALFGAAAFVVWQAPAILGEVVFEVLLGSPFVKGAKAVGEGSWAGALFTHTWKPFGAVAVFAMAFALFASAAAPQARTAAEVFRVLSTKAGN